MKIIIKDLTPYINSIPKQNRLAEKNLKLWNTMAENNIHEFFDFKEHGNILSDLISVNEYLSFPYDRTPEEFIKDLDLAEELINKIEEKLISKIYYHN